jgi:hypothetical protein
MVSGMMQVLFTGQLFDIHLPQKQLCIMEHAQRSQNLKHGNEFDRINTRIS